VMLFAKWIGDEKREFKKEQAMIFINQIEK
jgi:hypothetical protein